MGGLGFRIETGQLRGIGLGCNWSLIGNVKCWNLTPILLSYSSLIWRGGSRSINTMAMTIVPANQSQTEW